MTNRTISRRGVLKAGAAMLGAAMPPAVAAPALAQGGFDWTRFKGEHLEVLHTLGPRATLLQKHEKEFQDLTGISVGSEQVPEQREGRRRRLHDQVHEYLPDDRTDTELRIIERAVHRQIQIDDTIAITQ